jgi:hypothetical protein
MRSRVLLLSATLCVAVLTGAFGLRFAAAASDQAAPAPSRRATLDLPVELKRSSKPRLDENKTPPTTEKAEKKTENSKLVRPFPKPPRPDAVAKPEFDKGPSKLPSKPLPDVKKPDAGADSGAGFVKPLPRVTIDPESLLERRKGLARPISQGSLAVFGNRTVEFGEGTSLCLSAISQEAFAGKRQFRTDVAAMSRVAGVLQNAPEIVDEVFEFSDAYLIRQTTKIVVAKPSEAVRLAPESEFARFIAGGGVARPTAESNAADRRQNVLAGDASQRDIERGLAEFRRDELPGLPKDHPLAIAAARGDDALLRAIREGQGDFEVVEELSVPRRLLPVRDGALLSPDASKGVLDYSTVRPFERLGSVRTPAVPGVESDRAAQNDVPARIPELSALRQVVLYVSIGGREPAVRNGRFVSMRGSMNPRVAADRAEGEHEVFQVVRLNGDRIGLRYPGSGHYLAVRNDGALRLHETEGPGADGTFRLVSRGSGAFALLAEVNDRYVRASDASGVLIASAETVEGATAFRFEQAPRWQPAMNGRVVAGRGQVDLNEIKLVFRHAETGEVSGHRFADAQGAFGPYYSGEFGRRFTITPEHPDYLFEPQEIQVTADRNLNDLTFRATARAEELASRSFRAEFLVGDVKGNSWEWEKRWRYTSGFFRISLGASYGIGLRVPIEITGTMSPGGVRLNDGRDRRIDFTTSLQARTINANEGFYRRMGVAENRLFDGNETVFETEFTFGMKFRALWTDFIHIRPRHIGFNASQSYQPPFGGQGGFGRFRIPPHMTGTSFDWAVLWGSATIGADLGAANARIGVDYTSLPDGQRGTISLSSLRETTMHGYAPPGRDRFGFRLANPTYDASLSVTPGLEVSVGVGVSGFSRTFRTGWIPLNRFQFRLAHLSLDAMRGTPREFTFEQGRKILAP